MRKGEEQRKNGTSKDRREESRKKKMRQQGVTNQKVQKETTNTVVAALAAEPALQVSGMEMSCTECGQITGCWCDGCVKGGRDCNALA